MGQYDVSKTCLLRLLRREMGSDIIQDLFKNVHISETLPPHLFANIAFKHPAMSTVLSFASLLCVFLWVLYVLRVSTSSKVYKIVCVVYLQVTKSPGINITISCPHIRHDCCTWCNHLLDDRQQIRLDLPGTVYIKHSRDWRSIPPKTHCWGSTQPGLFTKKEWFIHLDDSARTSYNKEMS